MFFVSFFILYFCCLYNNVSAYVFKLLTLIDLNGLDSNFFLHLSLKRPKG